MQIFSEKLHWSLNDAGVVCLSTYQGPLPKDYKHSHQRVVLSSSELWLLRGPKIELSPSRFLFRVLWLHYHATNRVVSYVSQFTCKFSCISANSDPVLCQKVRTLFPPGNLGCTYTTMAVVSPFSSLPLHACCEEWDTLLCGCLTKRMEKEERKPNYLGI